MASPIPARKPSRMSGRYWRRLSRPISPATETRPKSRPFTFTTGVMPRRPQVRPVGGLRVNPASSSKQIQPPQAARVVYLRPCHLLPGGDGLLVAFRDSAGRDLRREADPARQPRRARDAAGDVKLPADQRHRPRPGPHPVLVPAMRGRPLLQVAGQLLPTLRRQLAELPARAPGGQRLGPAFPPSLLPRGVRLRADTQLAGHLWRDDPLGEQSVCGTKSEVFDGRPPAQCPMPGIMYSRAKRSVCAWPPIGRTRQS